ncbi:MAG TPA: hypothetical protein VJ654_12985 [Noviherbaspirillum sp.]|nr:hypothetical protein [Noviherbaspirillum sp.]
MNKLRLSAEAVAALATLAELDGSERAAVEASLIDLLKPLKRYLRIARCESF